MLKNNFSTNKSQQPANSIPPHLVNRELKQQRRLRKRHLKSVFALLQTLSRLFHLVHFVKSWRIFRELNSWIIRKRKRGSLSCCLVFFGRLFEAGRLLTFSALRIGAYSRWAIIRSWALIRINTVISIHTGYYENEGEGRKEKRISKGIFKFQEAR